MILDAVLQTAVVVTQPKPFLHSWTTVGAFWMAGSTVGRATGAVIVVGLGAFQIVSIMIIGFTASVAMLMVSVNAQPVPTADTDHYFKSFAHQHRCRWIKAHYRLALQKRKVPLSITAPLQYVFLIGQFYAMLLKPTHVWTQTPTPTHSGLKQSEPTLKERLYCDWCTTMDIQERNDLLGWLSSTVAWFE
jgi:hypothetical protein